MIEKKYFICKGFRNIAYNYRNEKSRREKGSTLMPSNRFEVLRSRVTNIGEGSRREIKNDRKMILREEREKKEKLVEIQKIGVESSSNSVKTKEKLLRGDSEDWIEIGG